jgi:hypothetical protein
MPDALLHIEIGIGIDRCAVPLSLLACTTAVLIHLPIGCDGLLSLMLLGWAWAAGLGSDGRGVTVVIYLLYLSVQGKVGQLHI